ncbi:MAG: DUF6527 family protein [Anaerolineaceae bacterium]
MLRKNLDDLETNGLVGDWSFLENKDGMHIFLRHPRKEQEIFGDEARGEIVHLPIRIGESIASPAIWGWNGNKEAPTITPSILIFSGDGNGGRREQWHGFLTDGKLVTV